MLLLLLSELLCILLPILLQVDNKTMGLKGNTEPLWICSWIVVRSIRPPPSTISQNFRVSHLAKTPVLSSPNTQKGIAAIISGPSWRS